MQEAAHEMQAEQVLADPIQDYFNYEKTLTDA